MTPARRGKRLMAEINVVPYIDVMLVLLIIFMITAPLLTQGIKVDLPKAGAEPLPQEMSEQQMLVLSIDKSGSFYLNIGEDEKSPIEPSAVVERVSTVLRREPKTAVLVNADSLPVSGAVATPPVALVEAVGSAPLPSSERNAAPRTAARRAPEDTPTVIRARGLRAPEVRRRRCAGIWESSRWRPPLPGRLDAPFCGVRPGRWAPPR